jgi:hypothetical protein
MSVPLFIAQALAGLCMCRRWLCLTAAGLTYSGTAIVAATIYIPIVEVRMQNTVYRQLFIVLKLGAG